MENLWKRERLLVLTWESLGQCLQSLYSDITACAFQPTTIIAISRGGLVPATFLSHALSIKELCILAITRNVTNEKYSQRVPPEFSWFGPQFARFSGKKVLLVDDIAGDGGTLSMAMQLLKEREATSIRTAVIAKNLACGIELDFAALTVDDWLVFPWERGGDDTKLPMEFVYQCCSPNPVRQHSQEK